MLFGQHLEKQIKPMPGMVYKAPDKKGNEDNSKIIFLISQ